MSGGVAARTLRQEGFDGRIVLIGDEPGVPFGRPPLSKTYLRGEEKLDKWLVEPGAWYADNDVERLSAAVLRVDVPGKRLEIDGGRSIGFDSLLIATGGRNRPLRVPGFDLGGIFQLRTVADCDAIKRTASRGASAVVVGMGFIGSEVAASLRTMGLKVCAVLRGAAPLDAVLGPEVADVMAAIHRDQGVELVAEDEVVRFEGADRVERAVTRKGRRIDCDLAVVAVGIEPATDFLNGSPVALDNGVLAGPTCQTNVPGVYASGDVANHLHPVFGRIRVEHYNNAEKQGATAARAMLGSTAEYDYIHTFWSDQYEHKLEYAGHVRRWDELVVRGSLRDRSFISFYLAGGMVRAAVGLNRGGDPEQDAQGEMAMAARMIRMGLRPARRALEDEERDLASMLSTDG